jgi:hypothetical protein
MFIGARLDSRLKNLSSIFQRTMESILYEHREFALAFIDNILVFTKGDLEQHVQHISAVIKTLTKWNLTLNKDKFKLACDASDNGIASVVFQDKKIEDKTWRHYVGFAQNQFN